MNNLIVLYNHYNNALIYKLIIDYKICDNF